MADKDKNRGSDEESEEEEAELLPEEKTKLLEDIRNPDVVTKYRLASEIANDALKLVIKLCVPGCRIFDLCDAGDKHILAATQNIYNKGKTLKGVGFPTCVSVNHVVGSFSPSKEEEAKIKAGDVVKIDLGVHIDGYLSMAAHTIVVDDGQITGKKADVIVAVAVAAEAAIRLLRPGQTNTRITGVIDKIAKDFGVHTVEGLFSHQVSRFEIDGEKVVANNIPEVAPSAEQRVKECKFEDHEVWALDIVMSTGTGKPSAMEERMTSVFKRKQEQAYKLKLAAPRLVFSDICKKFPSFPFAIRDLESEELAGKVRFGVSNCVKHELVEAYPVLQEKEGEFVAHYKFTALLLPNGTIKASGLPIDLSKVKSERSAKDAEVLEVLKMPLSHKKSKKKKKKTAKKPAAKQEATAGTV